MGTFEVSRSRRVTADAATVHALVDDFRRWTQWSPWEDLDANMTRTYSGAEHGVGAHYAWSGDKKAGAGHMTIRESTPDRIVVDLEFTEPFSSTNTCFYTFAPQADGSTEVTWTMTGPQSLPQKILFTAMRMNAKVAADFDKGLARLASAAEASPRS